MLNFDVRCIGTGVALEAWNLDKVEEAITRSSNVLGMLAYTSKMAHEVVESKDFRCKVLRVLVKIYKTQVRNICSLTITASLSI